MHGGRTWLDEAIAVEVCIQTSVRRTDKLTQRKVKFYTPNVYTWLSLLQYTVIVEIQKVERCDTTYYN